MARFDGKQAFITGGGTGIGLACAQAIVAGGGRVMLAARREEVLREAARGLGPSARFVRCDVTDDASVEAAIAATEAQLGPLTLAVNAAASGSGGALLRTPAADFARGLATELTGLYRCLRAEALAMQRARRRQHRQRELDRRGADPPLDDALLRRQGRGQHADALRRRRARPARDPRERGDAEPGRHAAGRDAVRQTRACATEYLSRIPLEPAGKARGRRRASWRPCSATRRAGSPGQCIGVDGGHTLRQGPDLVPFFQKFLPAEG